VSIPAHAVEVSGVEVYVVGLYLPSATTDSATVLRSTTPKRLVAVMKRDVGADQIGPALHEAILRAAGSRAGSLQTEIDSVVTSSGTRTPFHGSAALASAVFGMWLGPHPVEDSLRAGLLAGGTSAR
jgi:hypothetical protein